MSEPLLSVEQLSVGVRSRKSLLPVVEELDLTVAKGETVAIVGESGCGKSLTALSIMGLLRQPVETISGSVHLEGDDLLSLPESKLAERRGRDVAMIFQDPMAALNPVMPVGRQIEEAIAAHLPLNKAEVHARAIALMKQVQIADPESRWGEFPHRLSGGMCQRIAIAIAIACNPRLLIADEPTTALDVTIQAQVLDLLRALKIETGMGLLFITHDFGVVAEMADRVVVMYAGRKVEEGSVRDILTHPQHPYTAGLLALTMSPGKPHPRRLPEIPGMVPSLGERSSGCTFAPRCGLASDVCRTLPPTFSPARGHEVSCWAAEREAHVVALRH